MLNIIKKVSLLLFVIISISSAKQTSKVSNNQNTLSNSSLNLTIEDLAQKLLKSSRITNMQEEEIAITSFVDLHQFQKTTNFGRVISESFFEILFSKGFNISEFRGQENLTINANGEYFLTRDIKKLNKDINNKYVLVGTYSKFEKKILISTRIINNKSGKIVAAARSYYKTDDCTILNTCKQPRKINIRSHDSYVIQKISLDPIDYKHTNNSSSQIYKTSYVNQDSNKFNKMKQISLIN